LGMPSLRMALRGADVITVAGLPEGSSPETRVRLRSIGDRDGSVDPFPPVEFDMRDIDPGRDLRSREAFIDFASGVCSRREQETGSGLAGDWEVLPRGQLTYLCSRFRGRIGGFDGVLWSNVPSAGGMSSSSAVVVSTAWAAMAVNGLTPWEEMSPGDLADGIGISEWLRGTRGGCADHGGMIMGKVGELVAVGALPTSDEGRVPLPQEYAAVSFDTGVRRRYDEAAKDETVISYPLAVFALRELILPALARRDGFSGLASGECLRLLRDVTPGNLGLSPAHIFELLRALPRRTSLREMERLAANAGRLEQFSEFRHGEVADRYPHLSADYPVLLRRRAAFALAEQDRVHMMRSFLDRGDMANALRLIRLSHSGDRDQEVDGELLARHAAAVAAGEENWRLCFLPGGYGRMTPEYDRVVGAVNRCLVEAGGEEAGAVQRLGAGWGGRAGGLVRRDCAEGEPAQLAAAVRQRTGIEMDLQSSVVVPGEGASLLQPPS
ncbi:MAG: hypothetical protein OXH50_14525, partial [Gemmatimonadetes bacterium]|nr:hypothetical protein [Gemmatimonadota bacterium]